MKLKVFNLARLYKMTITKMEQTTRRLEAERFLKVNDYNESELLNVLTVHFALDCDDGKKLFHLFQLKLKQMMMDQLVRHMVPKVI